MIETFTPGHDDPEMLDVIMHVVIKDQNSFEFILDDVIRTVAEIGQELNGQDHQHWWVLNDTLDDLVGLRTFYLENLKRQE